MTATVEIYQLIKDFLYLISNHEVVTFYIAVGVLFLFAIVSILLHLRTNHKFSQRLTRAISNTLSKPESMKDLKSTSTYETKIFDNFSQVDEKNIVIKRDFNDILYDIIESAQNKFASRYLINAILPIALMLTFLLIAASLPGLASSMEKLASENGNNSGEALMSFASTLKTISTKFMVSVSGLFLSIVSSWISGYSDSRTKEKILNFSRTTLENGKFDVLTESEVSLRNSKFMSDMLSRNADFLEKTEINTRKIDHVVVKVEDFSEEVIARLENMVTRSLTERLTELSLKQTEELKNIANAVTEKFAGSIENSMNKIAKALEDNINILSEKVSQQGSNQFEGLLKKFESTVSGGMSTHAADLKDAISEMKTSLPDIVASLKEQALSLSEQRAKEQNQTSETISAVSKASLEQQKFIEKLQNDIQNMTTGLDDFTRRIVQQNREGMERFAESFIQTSLGSGLKAIEAFELAATTRETERSDSITKKYEEISLDQKAIIDAMKGLATQNSSLLEATKVLVEKLSSETSQKLTQALGPITAEVTKMQTAMKGAGETLTSAVESLSERESQIKQSLVSFEKVGETMEDTSASLERCAEKIDESIKSLGEIAGEIPKSISTMNTAIKDQGVEIARQKVNLEEYSRSIARLMKDGVENLCNGFSKLTEKSERLGTTTLVKVNDEISELSSKIHELRVTIDNKL